MRRSLKVAAAVVLAVFVLAVCGAAAVVATSKPDPSSVVMVKDGGGHGSGVHIGNGYILTAAHVVGSKSVLELKMADGRVTSADVLWSNSEYDIALMRTSAFIPSSSHVQCRAPAVGEEISTIGSPIQFEFVSAFGHVASDPRQYGKWKSVSVTDMTVVMGQSGAPVFDNRGNVVGIVVGVAVFPAPAGFALVPSLTGYGIVVPSADICTLLAAGEDVR